MPTGYTAKVPDGISFEEFVWHCARGMGALVLMRDMPSDAPIPERFEPSKYHAERLQEHRAELERLLSLSPAQIASEFAAAKAEDKASRLKMLTNNERVISSYRAMLDRVLAWEPPTADHIGFKDFMADQLRKSIDFDDIQEHCRSTSSPQSPEQWVEEKIAQVARSIEYAAKCNREEVERTEARNRWISALRDSLAGDTAEANERSS